jgi:putative transposase
MHAQHIGIREKPHRLPRLCYRGAVTVSITACICDRRPVFTRVTVVNPFVELLRRGSEMCSCRVLIYCFMPDHLHLVLQGENADADTWRAMVHFKQHSGFWLRQHRPAIRWQKDFHDHIVRAEEDLRAHVRYIAENPVRKGLVEEWQAYPFTGAIGCDLAAVLESANG